MLPQNNSFNNDGLTADFTEVVEPTNTFKLHDETNRCYGSVDDIEALKQAIFLMLSIERYDHIVYSWNVGFESKDLIGKPYSYVVSEVKRRIEECLTQDDRINSVDSFEFTRDKKRVHVTAVAHTIYGSVNVERQVNY